MLDSKDTNVSENAPKNETKPNIEEPDTDSFEDVDDLPF